MKIRIEGTPRGVEAFAAFLRAAVDVQQESQDYANRPPSTLVRRYIDAELREEHIARPSPLAMATEAKRLRALGAEVSTLQRADADLNEQPWLPLVAGDIVLQGFADHPDLSETYLAVPDGSREGAGLALISSNYPIHEGAPLIPFYDLWFEAGRDALTVIRHGRVVFGRPQAVTAAG